LDVIFLGAGTAVGSKKPEKIDESKEKREKAEKIVDNATAIMGSEFQ
jgi:hypothetical protein